KKGGILSDVLGYRYPQGAVLGTDRTMPVVPDGLRLTGEPGSRAPHMWLSRAGTRISTLDLYERSLVLLSSEDGACDWHTAATRVAQQLSVPLDSYRIGAGPAADLAPASETDWAEVHGATPDGAVLVRPDGFVAWRSEGASADPGAVLRQALTAILGRD
ncbi:monooxygenase, partial [Streptomyces hydrogenans]